MIMAAIKTCHSCLIIFLVLFIVSLPTFSSAEEEADDENHQYGNFISLELIHRDSPKSPLYSPAQSTWQRLANALQRSNQRANHFEKSLSKLIASANNNKNNTAQSELFPSGGEYLMNISLGNPRLSIVAIADTGSDLIWTQCKPCKHCFKQKGPLFDPKSSSTFDLLSCKSKECNYLDIDETSCYPKNYCHYTYIYGDLSFTNGNLALETVTLSSLAGQNHQISFPKTIFGCGFHNGGIFSGVESGIIGLGGGKLSLVSQMGSSINGKFSYCLVPMSSRSKHSSKLTFGGSSLISGPRHGKVFSTPLLLNGTQSYYYLALKAVSVGHKKFDLERNNNNIIVSKANFKGNIIIDSGTTLTYLPTKLYNRIELEMRKEVKHLELANDPNQVLTLCYKTKSDDIDAPVVTFHFDGADVELKAINTFLRVEKYVICFAFTSTEGILIYGNVAQINFQVQYGLTKKTLSFKPTDCTK